MKYLILALLALSTFGTLAAQNTAEANMKKNETSAKSKKKAPALIWDKIEHDFGAIPQGKPVTAVFKVKNKSKSPMVFTSVNASCGCTTPNYTKEPIAPGKTGEITATYNALAPGEFTKQVTVITSLSDEQVVLRLKGKVEQAAN
ncbi:MAG: DUF1573 domain-containing protein [Haliscomenobacter sp.]|uniref:DUF1573 domain-containing protein n=1 Tax=Haliscomenobacter sp. TaxID=2717303 RepID=UPI0029B75DDC|nr:DUF1573 domain-containing protein [Haliscomenobacter sp.]MDX2069433.1 DUF1573 domain-containing protein [Haliscomenobacter sp.]